MNCFKQTVLQVLFLFVFVGIFAILQHKENQWDFIVYAQQWPQAACVDINESSHETCVLNEDIKTWTIHGIWPSRYDGQGPFYCNDSCPFQEYKIAKIEDELMRRWPNLIRETPKTDFWKHEWVKHGTCAMSLPALDTETNYFSKGLQLNKLLNFKLVLEKKNITPSNEFYKLNDIRTAIESSTQSSIIMRCLYSEDKSHQAIIQVEVCMNKKFTPIDCLSSFRLEKQYNPSWNQRPYNPAFEPCSEELPVQYLPLVYNY